MRWKHRKYPVVLCIVCISLLAFAVIVFYCVFPYISGSTTSVSETGGVSPPTHIDVISRRLSVLERIGNLMSGPVGAGISILICVLALSFIYFRQHSRKDE